MPYLLNLVYLLLIAVGAPWLIYGALRKGKYREGWRAKLLGRVPHRADTRRCVWLHAVSVGEVNLLSTLLSRIERDHPDWECVISTTTKTGFDLARKKYAPRSVFYCPLDFSWAVREAMRRVRPGLLVLAELELWPNLVRSARQCGAKVAVINGRLGEKSFHGYRRIKWLVARVLAGVDLVAAQNEEYAARFLALGARPGSVQVTGSLKFDGCQTDRGNPATRRLAALAGIESDDIVFLAGSSQEPEESLALEAFCKLSPAHPQLRLILVPRHPERFGDVAALLDRSGLSWERRSELQAEGGRESSYSPRPGTPGRGVGGEGAVTGHVAQDPLTPALSPEYRGEGEIRVGRKRLPTPSAPRVLLVDAVGELGAWWGAAHIAFVGGSLGQRGGQNMLEPAAYGAAVSFGPNTWNFKEIVSQMLAAKAACVVHSGDELTGFVERCLVEPEYAATLGERARHLVESQLGSSDRTMKLLSELMTSEQSPTSRRAAA